MYVWIHVQMTSLGVLATTLKALLIVDKQLPPTRLHVPSPNYIV
jgi:hypothetical protein